MTEFIPDCIVCLLVADLACLLTSTAVVPCGTKKRKIKTSSAYRWLQFSLVVQACVYLARRMPPLSMTSKLGGASASIPLGGLAKKKKKTIKKTKKKAEKTGRLLARHHRECSSRSRQVSIAWSDVEGRGGHDGIRVLPAVGQKMAHFVDIIARWRPCPTRLAGKGCQLDQHGVLPTLSRQLHFHEPLPPPAMS
ncbi:hypothetical protein LX36DRAFT_103575 [Colletotrichum falcatum]|nr:hypothetical protein LX36DRAFT_103575 [Colletotrichum falcatum]